MSRYRKTGRKQAAVTTRVGTWRQRSLFTPAELKPITLNRRQQIDRRLQKARQEAQEGRAGLKRARDEFWATWRRLLEERQE